MALHSTTCDLHPAAPFAFEHTLDVLSWFVPLRGEQELTDRSLTRAINLDGRAVVLRLEERGSVEAPQLRCTLWSEEPLADAEQAAVLDRLRFFLSLDDDLWPLYAAARGDEPFERVVARLYGYHQVKFPTPFENACWAVLTQRNTGAASRSMKDAIARRLGPALEVEGVLYQAFPEAEAVAALEAGEIAKLIGHAPKAAFVSAVAEAFSRIDERWLRSTSSDQAEAWLRGIHGIGAWSAAFVQLRGLGKMERLPHGDTRLVGVAAQLYERQLTWPTLEQLAERYGDLKGYWSHYLRIAG
jgi:DNA-3-methyladenine glycosylase II